MNNPLRFGYSVEKLLASLLSATQDAKAEERPMLSSGKTRSAERLFDQHAASIYRLAYSYLRNKQDAEDVLQDTLVQLIRTNPRFKDEGHEKAWLLRVAANFSKSKLRVRSKRQTDELSDQLAAEEEGDLAFVWEAVGQLPPNQREVIHLFYQEGYTTKEIARILERNESTVRSDLSRARHLLKDILKEAYDFG